MTESPLKTFIVAIEGLNSWKPVQAETAGKARYLVWLGFSDAYDMTFREYLKIVRVWRAKND